MILVVTLLLLAAVLIFVGAPLLRPSVTVSQQAPTPAAEQRAQLLSEREAALEALRDLEFERGIGNLDDADYAALRGAQRHKAVAILRELETLDSGDAPAQATTATTQGPAEAARATASTVRDEAALDARLEAEIAQARRRLAASLADGAAARRCPACAVLHAPGARYCTECGERFTLSDVCPACGAPRARRDRYCSGCGACFEQEDGA